MTLNGADCFPDASLRVLTLKGGCLDSLTYAIVTASGITLIDCGLPERLSGMDGQIRRIILTHGHFDHLCGIDQWRRGGDPAPEVLIHAADAHCLEDASANGSAWLASPRQYGSADVLLEDRQRIRLEDPICLQVLHTPGHSPGSCCLLLERERHPHALFSGDTLFAGTIGRTDLGGDHRAMLRSLTRIKSLIDLLTDDEDLPIYPGHGPATSLRRERRINPWMSKA